jgi:hypothetical protein
VIHCRADENVLRARLAARESNTRSVSDARLDLWPALRAAFVQPREMPEALAVDTSQPRERVVECVMRSIKQAAQPARGRTPA